MGLATRLEKLVPDIAAVLARFPIPAALSVLLCAYVNFVSAGSSWNDDGEVIAGAAAAFIAAGAAHLFSEGRGLSRVTSILIAFAAAVLASALGYFIEVFDSNLLFLFAGLIPVLMIAPYLRDNAKQGALWLFNLHFGLAVLLSIVVAVLFAAGLSAIVESLNFLFNANLHGNLHEHIWGTAASLIAPIYGLSLMPKNLDEEVDIASQKGTMLERGVSVLVNYVLVPVILIYAVILHAYAAKILIQQNLPQGQIATIVTIFALGGTGAWLIAWPWREEGTRLLRWFIRGWFWLTIVPAILLAIAIWRRISDYGVTPDRYGILLVAIWVAALTAYLASRRNRADMRAILGGIAVLLLIGSAGPMGANGLTISSQVKQLAAIFETNGLFKDGKAVVAPNKLSGEAINQGNSILYALREVDGLDRLRPWFEGTEQDPFKTATDKWDLVGKIAVFLGSENPQRPEDSVIFTSNVPLSLDLTGAKRLAGPFQAFQDYQPLVAKDPMTAFYDTTTLTIRLETVTYKVPIKELLEKTKARLSIDASKQPSVTFEIAPGVVIAIDSIFGTSSGLGSARFWLILQQ
ncbi:MAG TPA: DUF4153 domain-containing protein [Aestuariivirga sp.]|nr:DUF4153 domain-containing protein [Aestuariivirga sp.]